MSLSPNVVVLLGAPGAGKGTQAKALSEAFHIPQVSTGDLFRKAIENKTALGMKAKQFMDEGKLVPDDVTVSMLRERVQAADCKDGFILDGFPRTRSQAETLGDLFRNLKITPKILGVEVPEDELIARLTGRRTCKSCGSPYHVRFHAPKKPGVCDKCGGELVERPDDKPEVARNRLKVYDENTAPLIDYYKQQGAYKAVNGNASESTVFQALKALMGQKG